MINPPINPPTEIIDQATEYVSPAAVETITCGNTCGISILSSSNQYIAYQTISQGLAQYMVLGTTNPVLFIALYRYIAINWYQFQPLLTVACLQVTSEPGDMAVYGDAYIDQRWLARLV